MFLKEEVVENFSGVQLNFQHCVESLRKGYWKELNFSVGGDAPKNFIAVYNYERNSSIRKANSKTWPRYIAKVGHKWYPLESVNEYLFNRIGEELGLNIASSKLMLANKQLRFLSKYFLSKNESLEHGAQIFAGYIEDKDWVEGIERDGLARSFFTFQFAEQAIRHTYPKEAEEILQNFVKMLIFDAISGNNDRHFYNWGVIKHVQNKKKPTFAPIFDSARGLFWNDAEEKLSKWLENPNQVEQKIKKYAEGSKPKIGWDGIDDLNHFDLIEKIFTADARYKNICKEFINTEKLDVIKKLILEDFIKLYSNNRIELLLRCITYRFERLQKILNK